MRDFSNYKTHIEIDMKDYSGKFHFNEQLKQEGTDIKINDKSTQIINDVDTAIRAIIRNHGNEYNESKEERSIMIDKKYNYKAGDYIKYLDDIYLTNSAIDKDNPFFNTAKMTKCNYILKWVDEGVLYTCSSIITNQTKYTLGIDSVDPIIEADSRFQVLLSNNENTQNIKVGQRFIFNDGAWRVTQTDRVSEIGLLSLLLGQDNTGEYDNLELEIADYYLHNYTITLNSTSESIQETSTFQITPVVTDNNVVVSNPTVAYTSSDETIATISEDGLVTAISVGNAIITATIGSVSTNLELTVTAKSVDPVVSYGHNNWSNGTTLKYMSSSTIIFTKTIDSVSNSTLLVNYLLDSDGTTLLNAGDISITRKTNTSFQIKNVKIQTNKSFTIQFVDSADGTVILSQLITLTGM